MQKEIITPLSNETVASLKAGDQVLISGRIYSARDAAHKKLVEALEKGEKLPIDLKNEIIYYAGPCPAKPGYAAGPFGPTTSGRMDKYAAYLLDEGLKGMMGKGDRNDEVIDSMKKNHCVYFAAIGGLGAYSATVIKDIKVIAYEELGAEALREIWVEGFPAIVAIDSNGNNLYRTEPDKYKDSFDINSLSRCKNE